MTTTVRRPTPVEQRTAKTAGDEPPDVDGRRADPTIAATGALTLLSLVVAVGFGRLFADGSYIVPVAATAIGCHTVAWAARRWALGPVAAFGALLVPVAVIAWLILPETTFFGVPTLATVREAGHELSTAYQAFRHVVAPTAVTDGFLIAAVVGVAVTALLADTAAFVVRATFEATIPSFTLFVFTATLGSSRYRALSVGAYLGAVLLFLMLHQEALDSLSASWFASRARGGRRGLLRAGAALGAIAVIGALLIGPHLPGAASKAVIRLRGSEGEGRSTRTTVSPLVNIRSRLVERANVEVFTVRSPSRAYWRLTSLDRFDGEIWSSEGAYERLGNNLKNDEPAPAGDAVTQLFAVSRLESIWLPGAYEPRRVAGVDGLSYNPDSGSIISREPTSDGLVYQVDSVVPHFTAEQLAGAPVGGLGRDATRRYTAMPAVSARVRSLAQEIAGRGSPYAKAKAIQDYLRSSRFTYDLRVPPGHDGRALDRFLFETRRGYCEQFAGSYAVLARIVGLPTRVAVGFTAGELNQDGAFHVRDLNAHAWPEVFLDGFGWVAFEPTPGRGAPGTEDYTGVPESQASVTNPATATTFGTTPTTEAAQNQDQATTTTAPPSTPPTVPPRSNGRTSRMLLAMGAIALTALAWGLGVPGAKRMRRARRRAAATDDASRVYVSWQEAAEALDATRVSRRTAETMREYAHRASSQVPLAGPPASALSNLADDAAAVSYGATPPEPASVARAATAAATVEAAVKDAVSPRRRLLWALDPRPLFSRRRA
jgi:transglutaminase-like putative cysteine protease